MGLNPSQGFSVLNLLLPGLPHLVGGGGGCSTMSLLSSFGLKTGHSEGLYELCMCVCVCVSALRIPECTLSYCPLGQAPATLTTQFLVTQFIAR